METRQATPEMVQKVLAGLQQPGINNSQVLGVHIINMQRAKNQGFPHDMYHENLEPVRVDNAEQELALSTQFGFVNHYIRQEWPQHWYRRNFSPKFEKQNMTNSVADDEFIESRLVRNADDLAKLKAQRVPKSCSAWVFRLSELPALPEQGAEDPSVTIARLQGQLDEAQRNTPKGNAKKKDETVAA